MKKDLYIDADHLLYFVAMAKSYTGSNYNIDEDADDLTGGKKYKQPLKALKKHFKELVEEYHTTAEVEGVVQGYKIKKVHLIFSDPTGNFRHDIFPEYKNKREEKPELFYRLRKWALKTYRHEKNVEADDVVAYYVRKGNVGISTDKDLLKGVPGIWYNAHYLAQKWAYTSKEEARKFCLMQSVGGDSTDGIPGIPGVALTTAAKRLDKFGWDWAGVVMAYELADKPASPGSKQRVSLGLTKKDAVLTRRLIGMDQWTPKKGLKLWEPSK